MIEVALCLHRADPNILARTFEGLIQQTLKRSRFRVLIVDNANTPRLNRNSYPLSLLTRAGVSLSILREPKLGVAAARVRALRQSRAPALVFVDADNVLDAHFLEQAERHLRDHPEVGCFSGKILLHPGVSAAEWKKPLLCSLAYRDEGDKPVIGWFRGYWKPWMPIATASMVLRRSVIQHFLRAHADRPDFYKFGYRGEKRVSGEDFLIAMSAQAIGLKCAYFPSLVMHHSLEQKRLTFVNLALSMAGHAVAEYRREEYLRTPPIPLSRQELWCRLLARDQRYKGLRAKLCLWPFELIHVAGRAERLHRHGLPILSF